MFEGCSLGRREVLGSQSRSIFTLEMESRIRAVLDPESVQREGKKHEIYAVGVLQAHGRWIMAPRRPPPPSFTTEEKKHWPFLKCILNVRGAN